MGWFGVMSLSLALAVQPEQPGPQAEIALREFTAQQVRRWAAGLEEVEVRVVTKGSQVQIAARGPTWRVRPVLAEAERRSEQAAEQWLRARHLVRQPDGSVRFDHALLAAASAPEVSPLAEELWRATGSRRAFVQEALRFVQRIPYARTAEVSPGELLRADRADCDGKAVLFLALVRARLPDVPLTVVYVPGHALVGIGASGLAKPGDRGFSHEGTTYLWAEPAGPAEYPLGRAPLERQRAPRREIRTVPQAPALAGA